MAALPDNTAQSYADHEEDEFQNLKTLVFKYDEAIAALLSGHHASYQLDTGQSMQRVTRFNIKEIQEMRDVAAGKLADLAVRLRKTAGQIQALPAW